jgi:hypothetical protein
MAYEVWAEYEGDAPEMVTKTLTKSDADRVKDETAKKSNVLRAWVKETDEMPKRERTAQEERTNTHWYFK